MALVIALVKAQHCGVRRVILALAAAFALLPAAGAAATSVTAAPPHDPKLGCAAIKQVITDLNAGRLQDPEAWIGPTFFSDAFGQVDEKEEAAFLHSLRHSDGKPDAKPMALRDVLIVHPDTDDPLYLVVLNREAWREKRFVDDGMLGKEEIDDPHYETDTSFWLVRFMSNRLTDFREAPEMYPLWTSAGELQGCY